MQNEDEEERLATITFKDTAFLQIFGLNEINVLDYFAQSQFYDSLCINEQLKMQARFNELEAQQLDITTMKGVEFSLWYFTLQPSYFVIRKSQRYSPTSTKLLAIYYIIDGTIFQAPQLHVLLGNRLKTALFFLEKAISKTAETALFHPIQGYTWKSDQPAIEKTRKELVDMAKNNKLTVKAVTLDSARREADFNKSISASISDAFAPPPPPSIPTVIPATSANSPAASFGVVAMEQTPSAHSSSATTPASISISNNLPPPASSKKMKRERISKDDGGRKRPKNAK